jgi:hypothetical protein
MKYGVLLQYNYIHAGMLFFENPKIKGGISFPLDKYARSPDLNSAVVQ